MGRVRHVLFRAIKLDACEADVIHWPQLLGIGLLLVVGYKNLVDWGDMGHGGVDSVVIVHRAILREGGWLRWPRAYGVTFNPHALPTAIITNVAFGTFWAAWRRRDVRVEAWLWGGFANDDVGAVTKAVQSQHLQVFERSTLFAKLEAQFVVGQGQVTYLSFFLVWFFVLS